MAKRFDRLVPRHPNRSLVVTDNPDELPTRLTILLKSLYVRYLDTGQPDAAPGERGAALLVTAEVQSGKDAGNDGGRVSPVILEEFFSPGHFVNVRDRIVYGPKVYRGEFLNVKLSVVRLSNVNDSAVGEGLGMAMDSISKFNPGLSAVSPFVSSFFKGVLNNIDPDATELSYEFTMPAVEGKGKADVDMLRAETGHYIILKRENAFRDEFDIEKSIRRYTNNDIIYNPENGLLYHRVDMETPQNNFRPENMFREQTYMVLVVTDEYVSDDNLGAALRAQLGATLGSEVSNAIIPTAEITQGFLGEYQKAAQFQPPSGGQVDDATATARLQILKNNQDELWSSAPDWQKALIVEGLYAGADAETQNLLGKDVNAWKRASLDIAADGRFTVLNVPR